MRRKQPKKTNWLRSIGQRVLNRSRYRSRRAEVEQPIHPFIRANHPPSVFPKGEKPTMAMDSAIDNSLQWAAQAVSAGLWEEGLMFLGYPYLAELTQRSEYRRISEVTATELTRKWVKIKSRAADDASDNENEGEKQAEQAEADERGQAADFAPPETTSPEDEDEEGAAAELADAEKAEKAREQANKIYEIEEAWKALKVRSAFKKIAEHDGFFGRAHLYLDTGDTENTEELPVALWQHEPSEAAAKVNPRHPLKAVKVVEAVWCYPSVYNATDPLAPDWYRPSEWFVMGKRIHRTRLLTFIGREVPDLLKPSYSFGGLSLSQMAKPAVDNWLRTRESVGDIINAFSVFVIATNLAASLQDGGDELFDRIELFNNLRDNRGVLAIDKNTEDFKNVAAPLGGLSDLQAQSQEHICSVSALPVVKFTGIQPQGLNADSEGIMRAFYDHIAATQEAFFRDHLDTVFQLTQLSLWGKVDEDLYYEFEPLREMDEKELADIEKVKADTDGVLVDKGIIDPLESRRRLASEPEGPYASINVEDVPEPPAQPEPGKVMEREVKDEGGKGGAASPGAE